MSRFDEIGLFWEDEQKVKGEIIRPQPPIPDTGWQRPTHFPDLSAAKIIALDVETYDPELTKSKDHPARGPGWARGKGHIVGISIGTNDGYRAYFPIRHEIEPEWNLDPGTVLRWLSDVLSNPHQPKIGANLTYDIGWLKHEGVEVAGELIDVQFAEALLDESASVALEDLGQKYLKLGKESSLLYQWCSDFYGGKADGKQRKNIWRSPPRLSGHYAESDVDLPLLIWEFQKPDLIKQDLYPVFRLECNLIRLMIDMRFAGVTVDLDKVEQEHVRLTEEIKQEKENIKKETGIELNVHNGGGSLSKLFDHYGIPKIKTKKGKDSFTKEYLKSLDHPFVKRLLNIKASEKFNSTFLKSYILESHVDSKVYCQFHQMRGEAGGTGYGRFSSSTPNLQNIPSRDKIMGPRIRGLFIPDEGDIAWRKYDYSQIEYRMLAHFAIGKGANEIRAKYNQNPRTDYHQAIIDLIEQESGIILDRKPAKTINFGLIYGMGIPTLAGQLGLPLEEAKHLSETYHSGVPFAQATLSACATEAETYGEIRTLLGRKARFNKWEPSKYSKESTPALEYTKAIKVYGRKIKRAYTYKALNNRLQGSAADLMKVAMWICYRDGVFAETGIPRIQVHDELNFSDVGGKDEAFREMAHIMETCLPLSVPVNVDGEIGPDWGHVEDLPK